LLFGVEDVRKFFGVSLPDVVKERNEAFVKLRFFFVFMGFLVAE